MPSWEVVAIVRPSVLPADYEIEVVQVNRGLRGWVRLILVLMALFFVGIFTIACLLNPYKDGQPILQGTHQQMNLPPCTFFRWTNMPCPSCGMTSSFSLLMHGDLWNSLRANWVGTGMALVLLAFIPWSLVCVVWGRWLWVQSVEWTLVRMVLALLVLMLLRWGIVLLMMCFE